MTPAFIRKEGSSYDLTLAMGILAASGQVTKPEITEEYVIMGELSLDGELRPIKGALPIALKARKEGFKGIILPAANEKEAAIVEGLAVYGANNIKEVIDFFNGINLLCKFHRNSPWENIQIAKTRRSIFLRYRLLHR